MRDGEQDRVYLITGATAGIGLATARALAERGGKVVLVGRNPQKGAATLAALQEQTGNSRLDYLNADLSSQAEVRRLAAAFQERCNRLDVLINNAGGAFLRRELTVDGIERTFALNHLSYFLLTNLLLDTLKASAPSRIVNVSSGSHRQARLDFDDLQLSRGYRVMRAYGQSKLANILFTYELARRLEGTGVTASALHPGMVATNIGKNNGWLARLVINLWHLTALSPDEGAETVVYLATSPEVEGVSGKYFVRCRAVPSAPITYDREVARRLWEVSAAMVGLPNS